ncbi:MAG: hypothetical protein E2598_05550 [Sphingobium sp.]|nr:hypothetical protein [Sphingobium sp.]
MIARIFLCFLILGVIAWAVKLLVIAAIVLALISFIIRPLDTVVAIIALLFTGFVIAKPLIGIPLLLVVLAFNHARKQEKAPEVQYRTVSYDRLIMPHQREEPRQGDK